MFYPNPGRDQGSAPVNFVDSSVVVGKNVSIWHFAVVLADVIIEDNVSIGSGCEIGRGSVIGRDTRISAHVFLPPKSIIGRNVFIGPGAIFTDDKYPKVNNSAYARPPVVEDGAVIGAGAVVLPGVVIGENAMVGAGAVVTKNVVSGAIVYGVPAKGNKKGY